MDDELADDEETRDQAASALWAERQTANAQPAREELFSLYLPFATRIARRHFLDRAGGDIEYADLCQLAYAGLLEAIDRFDPGFGAPFTSYAGRRISGSIVDGIAKTSEVREQISFRNRVRSERIRSINTAYRETQPIAEAIQSLKDLAIGLALGFVLDGTGLYAAEGQVDVRSSAYEMLAWKETVSLVLREVERLPERENAVMRHHYLNGLAFEQIGGLMGLSKGRISQLHSSALERLRKRMQRTGGFHLQR